MSFTGNASYTSASNAAFAVEQSVSSDWQMIWTTGHPLLSLLADQKKNFNQGFTIRGLKMLLAIMGDDQTHPVAGIATGSAELVADTYNDTNGMSQAAYNWGHYRGHYTMKESDYTIAANGQRGNQLEGKKNQMLASFQNKLSTHIATTTADASDNSKVLGMYQVLSTSNTVGGISQSTDTQWAASLKSGAGPFALELVEDVYDGITAQSNVDRKIKPDIAMASFSASNNVYGKYRSALSSAERMVNINGIAKYGFDTFTHMGIDVVKENRIANTLSGSIALLTSATWYALVQKKPKFHPLTKIPGTDAYEQFASMWAALGCNDPAANALIRDIT